MGDLWGHFYSKTMSAKLFPTRPSGSFAFSIGYSPAPVTSSTLDLALTLSIPPSHCAPFQTQAHAGRAVPRISSITVDLRG